MIHKSGGDNYEDAWKNCSCIYSDRFLLVGLINGMIYVQFQSLIANKVITTNAQLALQLIDAKFVGKWKMKDGKLTKEK
ncbi:hypothetical protein JS44_09175 [Anoxybacillus flavithermus]|uniref:Uncharacterized protein n=1 Tax=Anoxybacillus flavithermus TaxID=33934 RepID=A0A094IXI1_9BACL|nr:hypothetical protein JS44_09175 [Anoxybacillus flavithermus]